MTDNTITESSIEPFIITLQSKKPPHTHLILDGSSGRLKHGRHDCDLTPTETRLAWLLFTNPVRTFSPHEIARHVWGYEEPWADMQVVYTTISRLKKKITAIKAVDFLSVRRGFGYRANGHTVPAIPLNHE